MNQVTSATYVASKIQQKIILGEFPPETRLPSEIELAQVFGVSRSVIRDATKLLVGQNVLEVLRGKGVYVKFRVQPSPVTLPVLDSASIHSLYQARKALETQVVKEVAHHASDEEIKILDKIVEGAATYVRQGKLPKKLVEFDDQFHHQLTIASHNGVFTNLLENMRDMLVMVRMESLEIPGRPETSVQEHKKIKDFLLRRDSEGAAAAMYLHLDGVERTLIENLNMKL